MTEDTQVLTKRKVGKVAALTILTGFITLIFSGIYWICGSILHLQNDTTEIKALLKERFEERPDDMALWEQIHKHEENIRELEVKSGISEALWKLGRELPEPGTDEPREERPERLPEHDVKTYRRKHIRPWVQQSMEPSLKK